MQLHVLEQPLKEATDVVAFASWEWDDDEISHCRFRWIDDELQVTFISIFSDSTLDGYEMQLTFRMDAERSRQAENADPVERFRNMWDGSEKGWRLVQDDKPVFLAEFNFAESGPTREEIPSIIEFVGKRQDETEGQLWERLRDCTGMGIAGPLSEARMECLRQHQREYGLDLTVMTIAPDDYLVLNPNGSHYGWTCLPEYRRPVIDRMLDAGIPVVSRCVEQLHDRS